MNTLCTNRSADSYLRTFGVCICELGLESKRKDCDSGPLTVSLFRPDLKLLPKQIAPCIMLCSTLVASLKTDLHSSKAGAQSHGGTDVLRAHFFLS